MKLEVIVYIGTSVVLRSLKSRSNGFIQLKFGFNKT